MRILIISDVPLRNDNSVGNTYSNILKNMENVTFANLYSKAGVPDNEIISQYHQITEKMILSNTLKWGTHANKVDTKNSEYVSYNKPEQKIYDIFRTLRFQVFYIMQDLIWKTGKWKTKELHNFLDNFQPDIIISFCLSSIYYLNLIQYCRDYSKARLVLYFTDDIYSYRKVGPIYGLYQNRVRKKIRKMVENSDLIYGATPQLCNEFSVEFRKKITLLNKVCDEISDVKPNTNEPLKLTYTGNLFYGRWKTLALVGQAIKEINTDTIKVQMDIYTAGLTTKRMANALNIENSCRILGTITFEQVKKVLQASDVVLHVESFEKKEIKKTRLSFSTKIVDCMQSGSCILGVGPEGTASIKLLKDYNIALVVTCNDKEEIKEQLIKILDNKNLIKDTAKRMNELVLTKYSLSSIKEKFYVPLENLCKRR